MIDPLDPLDRAAFDRGLRDGPRGDPAGTMRRITLPPPPMIASAEAEEMIERSLQSAVVIRAALRMVQSWDAARILGFAASDGAATVVVLQRLAELRDALTGLADVAALVAERSRSSSPPIPHDE